MPTALACMHADLLHLGRRDVLALIGVVHIHRMHRAIWFQCMERRGSHVETQVLHRGATAHSEASKSGTMAIWGMRHGCLVPRSLVHERRGGKCCLAGARLVKLGQVIVIFLETLTGRAAHGLDVVILGAEAILGS